MKKDKINNIFDWLNHISYLKTEVDQFSDQDWDKFNSYMIHRFVSMYGPYASLVNELQLLNPLEKKAVYLCYKNILPKKKTFFKYIKSKVKQPNKELIDTLTNYYKFSEREVKEVLTFLDKDILTEILQSVGKEEKEIKKVLNEK